MSRTKRFLIVIVLLGLSYLFVDKMPCSKPVQTQKSLASFPFTISEWTGQDVMQEQDELPSNTDEYLYRKYINAKGESLFLYIGFWGKYRHGADVFSGRHLVPAYRWDTTFTRMNIIDVRGQKIPVKEVVYAKGKFRISQFYWYITKNGIITRRFQERLRQGIDTILDRDTHVALIRISSRQYLKEEDIQNDLIFTEFSAKILPLLKDFLPFQLERVPGR